MAKAVFRDITPYDQAVIDFVKRIGADERTGDYVANYIIERQGDGVRLVHVSFHMDDVLARFGQSVKNEQLMLDTKEESQNG